MVWFRNKRRSTPAAKSQVGATGQLVEGDPPSESTPLLRDHDHDHEDPKKAKAVLKETPLPWTQMAVIIGMRLTEPVSGTVLQPFINQMIERTGITDDPSKVGYYSGMVTALFSLTQLCTVFQWGRLSDRIGRKPVLLTGLTGVMISTAAFGLQTTFPGMIVARCISGAMNGNIAVIKSVLAEITDPTNQARAFAILPMTFGIGSIIGPALGGYLAEPVSQYPNLFGNSAFFKKFPYFLPCAVAALMNLAAILLGFFLLPETLPSKVRENERKRLAKKRREEHQHSNSDADSVSTLNDLDNPDEDELPKPAPRVRDLMTRPILLNALLFGLLAYQDSAYAVLVPLFSYTPINSGGIGFSLSSIGTALSVTGFGSIFIQIWVFPTLQKRLGTVKVLRIAQPWFMIIFAMFPILNAIARTEKNSKHPGVWVALIFTLWLKTAAAMVNVCTNLLINNAAPSREALGTLNGMSQSAGSLARAIGPVTGTTLFAATITYNLAGGYLVWLVLILVSGITFLVTFHIHEMTPEWMKIPRAMQIEQAEEDADETEV